MRLRLASLWHLHRRPHRIKEALDTSQDGLSQKQIATAAGRFSQRML
jgi:hypothetical protein